MVQKMVHACPALFGHLFYYTYSQFNNDYIANVVIRCGMDINGVMCGSNIGKTVLMAACSDLMVEGVQMLLAAGANVNLQDKNLCTCLHHVASAVNVVKSYSFNRLEREARVAKANLIITMLKNAGVDTTIQGHSLGANHRKRTAKQLFEERNFIGLASML